MSECHSVERLAKKETRTVFRASNALRLLYLVLNIVFIWSIVSWFTFGLQSLGIALGIYLVSLLVALSPIGEFWLRWQTGCRRQAVKDEEANRILVPLFNEVYDKARELVPNLPNGICLYIGNGEEPNAFATGRKTICAERGVMKLPPEQIKAILAHEFGHIAHRDTYLLQAVVVGNALVTILVNIIRLAALFCTWIMWLDGTMMSKDSLIGRSMQMTMATVARILTLLAINVVMWIWTKIGVWMCLKSSRENEYEADRFAANCGYGEPLIGFFSALREFEGKRRKGLLAMLESSHPDTGDRIDHLKAVLVV